MPNPAAKFRGLITHKLGPTFRVAIPVEWRPETGEKLNLLSSRKHGLPMVTVLTEEEFNLRLKQIEDATNLTVAAKRKLTGALSWRSVEASINEQGKLLIPKEFAERVGLQAESTAVLLGMGRYFEVWSSGNFSIFEQRESELLEQYNEGLEVL